jgi:hypothetical protein
VSKTNKAPDLRLWFIILPGMIAWEVYGSLFESWAKRGPRTPQPETGHIYRIDNHGWVGYLTPQENAVLWLLLAVSLVGVAFAFRLWLQYMRSTDVGTQALAGLWTNKWRYPGIGLLIVAGMVAAVWVARLIVYWT